MKLTNSPWPMVRLTSFSAWTGPSAVGKVRETPLASITGAAVAAAGTGRSAGRGRFITPRSPECRRAAQDVGRSAPSSWTARG